MDNRGRNGTVCIWYGIVNLETLEETDTCAHRKNENGPCAKEKCPEKERFEGGANAENIKENEVHL